MPSTQTKTLDAEATLDAPLPVIWTPPADPGDAGGMRNGTERTIVPGTLHATADEAVASGSMWRPR